MISSQSKSKKHVPMDSTEHKKKKKKPMISSQSKGKEHVPMDSNEQIKKKKKKKNKYQTPS